MKSPFPEGGLSWNSLTSWASRIAIWRSLTLLLLKKSSNWANCSSWKKTVELSILVVVVLSLWLFGLRNLVLPVLASIYREISATEPRTSWSREGYRTKSKSYAPPGRTTCLKKGLSMPRHVLGQLLFLAASSRPSRRRSTPYTRMDASA